MTFIFDVIDSKWISIDRLFHPFNPFHTLYNCISLGYAVNSRSFEPFSCLNTPFKLNQVQTLACFGRKSRVLSEEFEASLNKSISTACENQGSTVIWCVCDFWTVSMGTRWMKTSERFVWNHHYISFTRNELTSIESCLYTSFVGFLGWPFSTYALYSPFSVRHLSEI